MVRAAAVPPAAIPTGTPVRLSSRAVLVLVVAGTIISLSMGMRQSLGLFLPPMHAGLGISASAFGLAMALQNIVWGLSQPVLGLIGDRFGARLVLIGSAAVYAAGLGVMAFGGPGLGLDGGGGVLIGLGISGTGFGVLVGAVSKAVPPQRRSQMVGLVSAAGSLATFVLAPLGQALIGRYGWQTALVIFAGFALAMGVIAVALQTDPAAPSAGHDSEQRPVREMLRAAAGHRGFVAMTVAFFACGFQLSFITFHLPEFLAICGVSSATTASAMGLIGLSNAIGSYVFGQLGARYSQKKLLAAIYLLRTLTIGVFLLTPVTPASTLVFAAAMGFLWLGVVPLVSSLIGRLFGLRYFNTLFGMAFFSHQVGAFLGSWLGGLSFDVTGSYGLAWSSMIAVGVTAAAIQWLMDDRDVPGRRSWSQALLGASA
jgi:predicted MFS family arabinose efflux permease